MSGIYIASKTSHAARWRELRATGLPIVSTWIDEAGVGETSDFSDLWRRCIDEASNCDALIVYCEEGEILKGAWVEVGAALSQGKPVFGVGVEQFTVRHHAGVRLCDDLDAALAAAISAHHAAIDEGENACYACLEAFIEGDPVYYTDDGYLHASCLGPDRIAFYNSDEAPLSEGEPIPRPTIWRADPSAKELASDEVNDAVCVDRFAVEMKMKLGRARLKGRGGWDDSEQCSMETLSEMLHEHVRKGDPLDVANFAMMIHQRGGVILPEPADSPAGDALAHTEAAVSALCLEAYRGRDAASMSPVDHFTIAEDLKRIDSAIGPAGESIFARIADKIQEAYVELLAARAALSAARRAATMADRVYTEGFPERWSMVHRDDCTLLVRRGDMGFLVVPSKAVCMAPTLMQGEAWLETAKEIAHALTGSHEQELSRIFAEFCDSCGIGPPHDENDQPRPNIRSVRTWTCDRCDHINVRPAISDTRPPSQEKEGSA